MRIEKMLNELSKEYRGVHDIFGGAFIVCGDEDKADIGELIKCIPMVAISAYTHKWHNGVDGALRLFCQLCRVDSQLIEACIGKPFSEYGRM